jgi:hypothetical protein
MDIYMYTKKGNRTARPQINGTDHNTTHMVNIPLYSTHAMVKFEGRLCGLCDKQVGLQGVVFSTLLFIFINHHL